MVKAQTLLKCRRCSILIDTDLNLNSDSADMEPVALRKAFDLFQDGNRPSQRRQR
jgi:hypothetical protein